MAVFKLTIASVSIKITMQESPLTCLLIPLLYYSTWPTLNIQLYIQSQESWRLSNLLREGKKTTLRHSAFILNPTKNNKTEGKETDGEWSSSKIRYNFFQFERTDDNWTNGQGNTLVCISPDSLNHLVWHGRYDSYNEMALRREKNKIAQ